MKTQIPERHYFHPISRMRKPLLRLLIGSLLGVALPAALAANWAWDTSPGGANFNSANWTSGAIPGADTGTPASADSLYFGASSQLSLSNDFSGFTFNGLTFNSDANAYTIGGNAITLGGNIVNSSASLQAINLNLALGAARTITTAAGGGDLTLGGNISGAFALTNNGAGVLTLSGTNTYSGSTIVNGGTLNYSGSLNASSATFDSDGRVNVSGTLNVNQLWIGDQTGGAGAVYQTGGSITLNQVAGTDNLRIGSGTNGYGYLNISGGTLAVNQGVVAARGTRDNTVGVLDFSGGTLNNASFFVVGTGINKARAVANISGGTLNFSTGGSGALYLLNLGANTAGSGFTSILNLGNGAGAAQVVGPSTSTASRGVIFANSSVTNSLVVANLLPNGTLTVSSVTAANAASTNLFNFNGGTLKATALNVGASFLTSANLSGVYVYGNGGTIDNNGTAITISRPLLAPTGNGINGIASFTGGAGYIGAPFVAVSRSSGDTTGFGATAIAQIDSSTGNATSGQVTNVVITNPGNGYTAAPTFTLTGGGATTAATITGAAPTANTSGGLTFIGSGTTTLSGVSTYTGATTVNAGTLALSGSGSLASSSALAIAGGATLNVSGLSSTFTLGASQTLSNSSPTARIIGNINASSGTLSLTYAGGPPAFTITNGTLTLSAGTVFNLNNTGTAFTQGSYIIVSNAVGTKSGAVAGTVPATVAITGSGTTAPASLQVLNGALLLVVTAPSATTLASSENPAGYLDALTFTTGVQTNGIAAGNATGSVIYLANGVAFSTNTVTGGVATSDSLNGLPRGTTNLITAVYSGDENFPADTNSLFQTVTNHPPVAGNVSYPRDATSGSLSISISDLLTHVADVDGDAISLVSVGVSSQGITLIASSDSLLYNNPKAVTDQFTYTVTDGFGGTNTALVNIVLTNYVTTLSLVSSSQTNGYLGNVAFAAAVQTNNVTAGDATGTGIFFVNGIPFSTNDVSGGSAASASISNLPRGASVITAVYSGDVNYPAVTNTLTQTVTNHPPVASNVSYTRVAGQSTLNIPISDLLNAATDQDGDSVSLAGVGASTRGITVSNDGTDLNYSNPNNVNDQFTYTVSDGFGGTNSATVNIARHLDPKQAGHHNILLLIGDDIGMENLSIYNTNAAASIPYTPNLTALGQSGVAFTHFYARPSCSVSRASIITGRDAFRTGIGVAIEYPGNTGSYHALGTNEYTLPRAFATNAPEYALASVGKFHLGLSADLNSPWTIGGWTNFVGFLGAATSPSYFSWTEVSNGVSFNSTVYTTSDQVNNATNFIAQQGTNRWFLWLAFNAAHQYRHKPPTNLLTSAKYIALSGTAADISANGRVYYEAMIQALDTEIGRLLKSVDTNDTDIIFLGDNGTEENVQQPPFEVASVPATITGDGHGKFTLYEGGSRTPLIITGPDVGSPGRYNESLVNEPDIWATIQELAGIDVAATIPQGVIVDSVSLLPAIKADVIRPTPFVIEEQFNYSTASDGVALSNGRFKLVHFASHVEQFYDVAHDPYEYTNLLASPLSAEAQANFNAIKLKLGEYQTFANTNYTRNLLDYPQINTFRLTNGVFNLNAQFTQYSTNGVFANSNQQYPTRLANGGTNLNYQVILWRNADLGNPLGWTPVLTNVVTGITNNFLLSTNGWLIDPNANADHYFYRVSPYIP